MAPFESQQSKARSSEQIFAAMHRELRTWNPKVPESPERMDPILRMMLQLYAHQLSQVEQKVEQTWEVATNALIKSVAPEAKRWPVPAFTVMRCRPRDPVVEVDPYTRFFYRERREGGQTLFFSSMKKSKILAADVKLAYYVTGNTVRDLLQPSSPTASASAVMTNTRDAQEGAVYIAVEFPGLPSLFDQALVYLKGDSDMVRQLRWSKWVPGTSSGFGEEAAFCPGLTTTVAHLLERHDRDSNWGGLRTTSNLFGGVEERFVQIPKSFAGQMESATLAVPLRDALSRAGIRNAALDGQYYWIRLDLPTGGNRQKIQPPLGLFFDCFIALNKNELKLFRHTGGNRMVEIEIPEPMDEILDITQVVDSSGNEYVARHLMGSQPTRHCYSVEERDGRLVLWFDFFSATEFPPDALTVVYTVTAGTNANGVEAGKISELYESHPGISAVENLTPVTGAIPARTEKQTVDEVSARLRSRDRALSFAEIANWATTFDARITSVTCENGVQLGDRGVRRCIVVKVAVDREGILSSDEAQLLRSRLHHFLKERAPVNTQFSVEIQY